MSVDAEVVVVAGVPSAEVPIDTTPAIEAAAVKPRFGAGKATLAFLALLVAQFVAGMAVMVVAVVFAMIGGGDLSDARLVGELTSSITPTLLVAAGIASTLAAWGVARLWAWDLVRDTTEAGLGLTRARRKHVLIACAAGITLAIVYLTVFAWIVPYDRSTPVGPIAAAAAGGPLNRVAVAVLALLFAPVVEEFFFRGLLLKGFSTSWGPRAGAVAVTVLFVLLHLTETIHYWPATLAVTLMAVGALFARTVTGSLGPAVALHGSYNFVIIVVMLASPYLA